MAQQQNQAKPATAVALVQRSSELLQEAKKLIPSEAVTTVLGLQTALDKFHQAAADNKLHMLSPVVLVDSLMPMSKVSFHVATLDLTMDGTGKGVDVYRNPQFCDPGEVALTKNAIDKLQNAAGVEMGIPGTEQTGITRLDDRSVDYYWEYEVTMSLVDFDGTRRVASATKIVDLRDGAPATQKPEWICKSHKDPHCQSCETGGGRWNKSGNLAALDPSALAQMRIHGGSNCETKARLRCLRTLLRILQKYTIQQAAMPFVYPKLVANLDIKDPETKKALLAAHLGYGQQFFGPQPTTTGVPSTAGAIGIQAGALPSDHGDMSGSAPAGEQTINIEASEASDDDDDFAVTTPTQENPNPAPFGVCGCKHGCQKPLKEGVAPKTIAATGIPLCAECFPGKRFDFETHKDLSNLWPKMPDATPESIRAGNAARAAATQ